MNTWWRENWPIILILIVQMGLSLWLSRDMPDTVAVHYNFAGEPDRWGSKWELVLILPALNLFTNLLLWVLPRIDPKENFQSFRPTLVRIQVGVTLFLAALGIFSLLNARDQDLPFNQIIVGTILLLFAFLGNYFTRVKPNYFVGIRTPWTLESPEVWRKTHRLGGWLWFLGSLAMFPLIFFLPPAALFPVFLGFVVIISIVPVVYSYLQHQKLNQA